MFNHRRDTPRASLTVGHGLAFGALVLIVPGAAFAGALAPPPLPEAVTASSLAPAELTLKDLIERAWARSPHARRLEGAQAQAGQGADLARRWFPGAPSLALSHQDDRTGRDLGYREQELGLLTPLWLPGQRQAAWQAAEADLDHARLAAEALKLDLAGQVREAWWTAVLAGQSVDVAWQGVQAMQALEQDVQRRVDAGELARSDALMVRQERLAADSAWREARLGHAEAMRRLQALTGVAHVPALPAHEQDRGGSAPGDAPLESHWQERIEQHPAMRAALAAVEQGRRRLHQLESATRAAPQVGVHLRWERADARQPRERALGLSLNVPLGSDPPSVLAVGAARTGLAEAQAQASQLQESLRLALQEAREALQAREAMAAHAADMAQTAAERLRLVRRAYELGEQGLPDRLRAEATAQQAQARLVRDRALLAQAHDRWMQAQGWMP